jgi:hypothetical protein
LEGTGPGAFSTEDTEVSEGRVVRDQPSTHLAVFFLNLRVLRELRAEKVLPGMGMRGV